MAIFLPSFLLVVGGLPVWSLLSRSSDFQSSLRGINAVVVGLLLAALYDPVWKSAIFDIADAALAAVCLLLLSRRSPPWVVVAFAAAVGHAITGL
jgi:chromate transporter